MTGQTISHYRIAEKLGEGGMGVVYAAEDLRLKRRVALKFISKHLLEDREFRIRFVREAQATASLHHPYICTVFELDEQHGFLAMELVPGPSLRERIRERPLKLDEALRLASELGEALKAAHSAGVVHRDIKSANILLDADGHAKLMDFGLALRMDSTRVTKTGTVVGTPSYLSPEQARGDPTDRRSDLWALGVVLYEMVAGTLPFSGESETAVLNAILTREPEPLTAVRSGVPVELDRVMARCLAKDPAERYQYADDLLVELRLIRRPSTTTTQAIRVVGKKQWTPWVAAAVLAVGMIASLGWQSLRRQTQASPDVPTRRFRLETNFDDDVLGASDTLFPPKISPDGTMVVFRRDGSLWVRELSHFESRSLPNTEGAQGPFWSPDSSHVGFWVNGAAKKVASRGGEAVLLADGMEGSFLGGTWGTRGTILIATAGQDAGIFSVREQGGETRKVLAPDRSQGEQDFHGPAFLPDGESFVYAVHPRLSFGYYLSVRSRGASRRLPAGRAGMPSYDPAGYVIFDRFRDGYSLFALPFSAERLQAIGEPIFVTAAASGASVSNTGDLVYLGGPRNTPYEMVILDRSGKVLQRVVGNFMSIRQPALSDDARRIAFSGGLADDIGIWVADIERGGQSLFAGGEGRRTSPAWLAAQRGVALIESLDLASSVVTRHVDGSPAMSLVSDDEVVSTDPPTFSPDGRWFVYSAMAGLQPDLKIAAVGDPKSARNWLATPADERNARISPDGRYLAYSSDESGRFEVYVRRFPEGRERWQISSSGGALPVWGAKGDELFFVWENSLHSVPVAVGAEFRAGLPKLLFRGRDAGVELYSFLPTISAYDVSTDGQRVVAVRRSGNEQKSISLIQNWRGQPGR